MSNDSPLRPGFIRKPDGSAGPTASYALLARHAHKVQPRWADMDAAAARVLEQLAAELRAFDMDVTIKSLTLEATIHVSWPEKHPREDKSKERQADGFTVNLSDPTRWTVQHTRGAGGGRDDVKHELHPLEVVYSPADHVFVAKGDAAEVEPALMAIILRALPPAPGA